MRIKVRTHKKIFLGRDQYAKALPNDASESKAKIFGCLLKCQRCYIPIFLELDSCIREEFLTNVDFIWRMNLVIILLFKL